MKKLLFWLGGRPFNNDDLKALQEEIDTIEEIYAGLGAFILKGCEVTLNAGQYNIAPGVVYIGGKLARFAGAANIDVPCEMALAAAVYSDSRNDTAGNPHNAMVVYDAVLIELGSGGGAETITINYGQNRTYWDVVKEKLDLSNKANVAQPAWQPITLLNGTTDASLATNENYSPAYHKDTLGIVRLRGILTAPYPSGNFTHIGTLPVGFRPSRSLSYALYSCTLIITPQGNMNAWPNDPGQPMGISLEEISSFLAEQ